MLITGFLLFKFADILKSEKKFLNIKMKLIQLEFFVYG